MVVPILVNADTRETDKVSNGDSQIVLACANRTDDDIILIMGVIDGNRSGFNSPGFTLIYESAQAAVTIFVLQKRAASEAGDYTVNWIGNEQGRFMCARVTGCVTVGDPVNIISNAVLNSASVDNIINRLSSTVIDTLAIYVCGVDRNRVNGTDTITGTGWSEVGLSNSSGGANGAGLIVGENDMPSSVQVEAGTFGTWASDQNISRGFNLKSVEPTSTIEIEQGQVIA